MDNIFDKYRRRLKRIGLLRAAALALAVAFTAAGISALIAWAAGASGPSIVWIAAAILVGISAICAPLLYIKRFRPTNGDVAARLDGLGLDERAITMYECRNDPSEMAARQRLDAQTKISAVPQGSLKYTVAAHILVFLALGIIFAAGATAFSAIAAGSREPAVGENVPAAPAGEEFTVAYLVYEQGTGVIDGKAVQKIQKGGHTEAVFAVPAEGYRFAAWVDENMAPLANQNNPRTELNVREDITVYACFEKASPPVTDGETSGSTGDRDKNDNPDDSGGNEVDGDTPGMGEGEGEGGAGEGSEAGSNNNVIDGTQDYKENFNREELEKELADKDIPDDLKDILGDYYDTLKP